MKLFTISLAIFLSLLTAGGAVYAQANKTIILVRHAEKDTSAAADPNDPELSAAGRERAGRLADKIRRYKPGAVFSTDYKRTRETVAPMAERRHKTIQIYDARKPRELIDQILKSRTKRFLIAGHSNTIPALANSILAKELFKNLDEAEYGSIWVIRLKKNRDPAVLVLQY